MFRGLFFLYIPIAYLKYFLYTRACARALGIVLKYILNLLSIY